MLLVHQRGVVGWQRLGESNPGYEGENLASWPLNEGAMAEGEGLEPSTAADRASLPTRFLTNSDAFQGRKRGESDAQGIAPRPGSSRVPSPIGLRFQERKRRATIPQPPQG